MNRRAFNVSTISDWQIYVGNFLGKMCCSLQFIQRLDKSFQLRKKYLLESWIFCTLLLFTVIRNELCIQFSFGCRLKFSPRLPSFLLLRSTFCSKVNINKFMHNVLHMWRAQQQFVLCDRRPSPAAPIATIVRGRSENGETMKVIQMRWMCSDERLLFFFSRSDCVYAKRLNRCGVWSLLFAYIYIPVSANVSIMLMFSGLSIWFRDLESFYK